MSESRLGGRRRGRRAYLLGLGWGIALVSILVPLMYLVDAFLE